jgi:hypothetical protein
VTGFLPLCDCPLGECSKEGAPEPVTFVSVVALVFAVVIAVLPIIRFGRPNPRSAYHARIFTERFEAL